MAKRFWISHSYIGFSQTVATKFLNILLSGMSLNAIALTTFHYLKLSSLAQTCSCMTIPLCIMWDLWRHVSFGVEEFDMTGFSFSLNTLTATANAPHICVWIMFLWLVKYPTEQSPNSTGIIYIFYICLIYVKTINMLNCSFPNTICASTLCFMKKDRYWHSYIRVDF